MGSTDTRKYVHQHVSHYYNETYQQIQCDQPPINPPLPHHFGHLSHPIAYQSESEALYVKMGSVSDKQDDEVYIGGIIMQSEAFSVAQ